MFAEPYFFGGSGSRGPVADSGSDQQKYRLRLSNTAFEKFLDSSLKKGLLKSKKLKTFFIKLQLLVITKFLAFFLLLIFIFASWIRILILNAFRYIRIHMSHYGSVLKPDLREVRGRIQ